MFQGGFGRRQLLIVCLLRSWCPPVHPSHPPVPSRLPAKPLAVSPDRTSPAGGRGNYCLSTAPNAPPGRHELLREEGGRGGGALGLASLRPPSPPRLAENARAFNNGTLSSLPPAPAEPYPPDKERFHFLLGQDWGCCCCCATRLVVPVNATAGITLVPLFIGWSSRTRC